MSALRADGRASDEARPLTFERDFTEMAAGSVLVSVGRTRVLCTASVEDRRAALAARDREGMGQRGVLDAARLDAGAREPRGRAGQAVGSHPGDSATHRPLAAQR